MSLNPSGGVEAGQEVVLEFLLPMTPKAENVPPKKSPRRLFSESEALLSGPQRVRAGARYRTPQDTVGLEFVGLMPAHRQAIQRYITGAS